MSHGVYWILLVVSEAIFLIWWVIAIQQIYSHCNADSKNKARSKRLSLFIINIFFFSILNALTWLHSIYTNLTLYTIFIIWQAITAIIANHTWCLLIKHIIHTIDDIINLPSQTKKRYTYFINTMETIMGITAIFFHVYAGIDENKTKWINWYYITACAQILVLAVFILRIFCAALKLLGQYEHLTTSAIKPVRAAQIVAWIIIIACIIGILSSLQAEYNFIKFHFSYNQQIYNNIMFCITLFFIHFSDVMGM